MSLKPKPAGIMVLMSGQLGLPIGNHPALGHSNVDGMRVKIAWSKIEPKVEGQRDWRALDGAIAFGKSLNKQISISIGAGMGGECPQWMYAAGAQGYTITQGKDAGLITPIPGDPVYRAKWTKFIAAFGARYDLNPTVNYVVMTGIGNVVEWYTASGSDAAHFESLSPPNPPGTAKWIAQAQAFTDAYAGSFHTTPFFGALANPYGGGNGQTAEKTVVDWAANKYPGRFGVMTNTLSARSNLNFYPNFAINEYRMKQPTGFQMLWSCNDGGVRNGKDGVNPDPNALDESLTNGVKIYGRFVEVYESDCNNPALQDTITKHQAQFKALG